MNDKEKNCHLNFKVAFKSEVALKSFSMFSSDKTNLKMVKSDYCY